ncbi:hypothetical protein EA772_01315 [Pedobacter sp. G11]|uniref:hypothetical protein n=1 Tax=Pedobacter sp. G11 TaxID=2482728 RepID=UPI000F5D9F5B|nr:hypothetical protein [Pedobacter sp. G11]AZI24047.1 hypothetical protein EA772_01315 [Pedobacter sp. G11]
MKQFNVLLLLLLPILAFGQTQTRNDAGLQGNHGASSGFFETSAPVNYPSGAGSWWHLLDVRHSYPENNYAMQFAGIFFDQELFFRKTNNNPVQAWSRILLENNGRVGIGTSAARALLDVASPLNEGKLGIVLGRLQEGDHVGDGTFLGVRGYNTTTAYGFKSFGLEHSFYGAVNSSINFLRGGSISGGCITFNTNTNMEQMRLDANGNLLIGKISQANTTYKLDVEGKVRANEIVVNTNGADFVFEDSYHLRPLSDLDIFVKKFKHLPEIPPAKTMQAEGVSISELQIKLLQKVEELTLYLIEKDKVIAEQEKKLKVQQKELSEIKFFIHRQYPDFKINKK